MYSSCSYSLARVRLYIVWPVSMKAWSHSNQLIIMITHLHSTLYMWIYSNAHHEIKGSRLASGTYIIVNLPQVLTVLVCACFLGRWRSLTSGWGNVSRVMTEALEAECWLAENTTVFEYNIQDFVCGRHKSKATIVSIIKFIFLPSFRLVSLYDASIWKCLKTQQQQTSLQITQSYTFPVYPPNY